MNITAINLRPSICHDRADARDATVTIDGVTGDVTLLEEGGELSAWGDLEHWASAAIARVVAAKAGQDRATARAEIEAAVRSLV